MTHTEPRRPLIRSQSDLQRAWRHLVEPLGFGGHSLWLMILGADDRPLPTITEIESPELPDDDVRESFVELLAHLLHEQAPGGRIAFLRSRPGRGGANANDRAWAAMLYAVCRSAGVPTEVVHLASDDTLVPIPLDDLALT